MNRIVLTLLATLPMSSGCQDRTPPEGGKKPDFAQPADKPPGEKRNEDDCGEEIKTDPYPIERRIALQPKGESIIRLRRFKKCVKVDFIDRPGGTALPGSSTITLKEDLRKMVGGTTLIGFDAPAGGSKVGGSAEPKSDVTKWGRLRWFIVQGCTKVKFIQYKRVSTTLTPPAGVPDSKPGTWSQDAKVQDGTTPSTGSTPGGGDGDSGGQFDFPGTFGAFEPFKGQGASMKGAKFELKQELETFLCCDDKLLGFVSWGYTMTWAFDGTKTTPGTPEPITPMWHDKAADSPNWPKVKCKSP